MRETIDKLDFITIKIILLYTKLTSGKQKTKHRVVKKFTRHISDKRLNRTQQWEYKRPNKKWAKNLYISPRKIYRWKISIWKDSRHNMSLGNCKLKQRDTTIYVLDWWKFKTDNTKCCKGCRTTGIVIHCQWECEMAQSSWKTFWQFLQSYTWAYYMI